MWLGFLILHALLFWLDLDPSLRRLFGDEVMYRDVAERLARGEDARLDLLWPPLYAWFLAPFAMGAGWPVAVAVVQVALLAATSVLFRGLLLHLTGSTRAASIGQALILLDPHLAGFAHYLWPEILHLFLLALLVWLLVARPGHRIWWLAAGVTAGAMSLTKSFAVPFVPVILVALVLDLGWRRGLAPAAGIVALAIAVVLPTMAGNARREGAFVIADSSRFNLWVGLNQQGRRSVVDDIAGPEYLKYRASGATFGERRQILDARIAALVADRGLPALLGAQAARQYFRLFEHRTFVTEQLDGGPLPARGVGYVDAGRTRSAILRGWNAAVYALALAAAGPGLAATRLRGRPWLALLYALLAYGLLIFLGLEARSRYRVPLMLPIAAAAAVALARTPWRGDGVAPWRVALGAMVSILLLGFAFGGDYLP
jgi:hypothetical protein